MANFWFNSGLAKLWDGSIDPDGDVLKMILVTSAFNGDDEDVFVGDVAVLGELTRPSYARQTLANVQIVKDNPGDQVKFTSDAVPFGTLETGETIAGAILYRHVTNDADSPMILFLDLADTPTNGGPITVQPHADGWAKNTRAVGS